MAPYATKKPSRPAWQFAAAGLLLGGLIGVGIWFAPVEGEVSPSNSLTSSLERSSLASFPSASSHKVAQAAELESQPQRISPQPRVTFSLCHSGGGSNCVVDGDTLWINGTKVRVADIDTPETHPPRCEREAELGARATQRLLELVNAGPFEALPIGGRDQDQFGRKLRVLVRDGRSLGDVLVAEGVARTWEGSRRPWC
jgi:micrococcal nuclease